jgi:plasmid stability protein
MEKEKAKDTKSRMIHVRLPEELHKRLRVCAAEDDTTIQDWVIRAIQDKLGRRGRRKLAGANSGVGRSVIKSLGKIE